MHPLHGSDVGCGSLRKGCELGPGRPSASKGVCWAGPRGPGSPPEQLLTEPGPGSTLRAEAAGRGGSSTPRGGSLWKHTALCTRGMGGGLCCHGGCVLGQAPDPPKSKAGPCSAGTFYLLVWVWGHMEPCTYNIIDFPICVMQPASQCCSSNYFKSLSCSTFQSASCFSSYKRKTSLGFYDTQSCQPLDRNKHFKL